MFIIYLILIFYNEKSGKTMSENIDSNQMNRNLQEQTTQQRSVPVVLRVIGVFSLFSVFGFAVNSA
jgi:hypothetical protein